jgi:hypothetical protein
MRKTWSYSENEVPRKYGPKKGEITERRKLQSEYAHTLCSSQNTIRIIRQEG